MLQFLHTGKLIPNYYIKMMLIALRSQTGSGKTYSMGTSLETCTTPMDQGNSYSDYDMYTSVKLAFKSRYHSPSFHIFI